MMKTTACTGKAKAITLETLLWAAMNGLGKKESVGKRLQGNQKKKIELRIHFLQTELVLSQH